MENQERTLSFEEAAFLVNYHGTKLPLILESYVPILNRCVQRLRQQTGNQGPQDATDRGCARCPQTADRGQFRANALDRVGGRRHTPIQTRWRQATNKPDRRLQQVHQGKTLAAWGVKEVRKCIDDSLRAFQGRKGDSTSFDLLDGILEKQFYWLLSGDSPTKRSITEGSSPLTT